MDLSLSYLYINSYLLYYRLKRVSQLEVRERLETETRRSSPIVHNESEREVSWRVRARGRGLRWQMLRELVAATSKLPLTTRDCQTWMQTLRGLSNNTTRIMLGELRNSSMVIHVKTEKDYFWSATERGVSEFLGQRSSIPARIVEAMMMLLDVNKPESTP